MHNKYIHFLILVFCVTLSFSFITDKKTKEKGSKARLVLDKMSEKYKSLPGFSATFVQRIENKTEGVNDQIEGNILVKGAKYKLEVAGQIIYNDGQTVWTLIPDDEEVTITDVSETEENNTAFSNPSKFYDIYKKGFTYKIVGKRKVRGHKIVSVELKPENSSKAMKSVILDIDTNTDELLDWKIIENTGNEFIFSLSDFKEVDNLSDSTFMFNSSEDSEIEIIDLR